MFWSTRNRFCVESGCAFATVGIIAVVASRAINSQAGSNRRAMMSASFGLAFLQRKAHTIASGEIRQQKPDVAVWLSPRRDTGRAALEVACRRQPSDRINPPCT
jgi:hypothetical protein